MAIILLALAGLFLGGAISMYRQGASRVIVAALGLLSLVAGVGGVLWLLPG